MENYLVSFRKYRPDTFSSVVGQAHITNTLSNAVKQNQLAHAFLFCGPRGVGKTTCARILAKAVNCLQITEQGDPCNHCSSCISFNEGKSYTIHELDAASNNSVDDIRHLIEQIRYIPPEGAKAVYIIDEVHMLSAQAFNAFLKTLEEPPPYAIFILATTERHKILPTILSRCQKFDFRRIKIQDMADHLAEIARKEEVAFEMPALQLIAMKADGALRDALSLFDQIASFSNRNITFQATIENLNILDYEYYFKIVDAMLSNDHSRALLIYDEILKKGFDGYNFVSGLVEHFRNLIVAKEPRTVELLQTSDNVKKQYLTVGNSIDGSLLLNAFQLTCDTEQKYKNSQNPNLLVELLLLKLVFLSEALQLASTHQLHPQDNSGTIPKKVEALEVVTTGAEKSISTSTQAPESVKTEFLNEKNQVKSNPTFGKTTSLNIPRSLEHLSESIDTSQPANNEDSDPQPIEPNDFMHAYEKLLLHLENLGKSSLVAELGMKQFTISGGIWIQKVGSNLQKMQLEQEKQLLLNFIREQTHNFTMKLEIQLDENMAPAKANLPFSASDRLKFMAEQNPIVNLLVEKFNGQIHY
jgi:DNA polymerase-3 subunit gamma/tau